MCFICMRCGRCEGVEPHKKVKEFMSNPHPCLNCKSEIPQGARVCPNCGKPVPLPAGCS